VLIEEDGLQVGEYYNVRVDSADEFDLYASIAE
jgi:hypothetical protein